MTMSSFHATDMAESVADRDSDRRVLLLVSGLLLAAFAVGAAVQTVFVFRSGQQGTPEPLTMTLDVGVRTTINLLSVAVVLVLAGGVRLHERTAGPRILWVVATAVTASVLRFGAQIVVGIYPHPTWEIALTENLTVFLVVVMALAFGLVQTDARSRLRMQERLSVRQALRAAEALKALASEELRVRRGVAENLHGTVQNRLLLADVQLNSIIQRRREGASIDVAELEDLKRALTDIRERDVREMSHLLYPVGVNVGAGHAIGLLARRIPATIATEVVIDPELAVGDELSVDQRVLLVRAAEEAITNALKHGNAGSVHIELVWDRDSTVQLTVDNDGSGFPHGESLGSGLKRLSDRARGLGGEVALDTLETTWTRLRLSLPV
jgi:signal transduction histidine kinase